MSDFSSQTALNAYWQHAFEREQLNYPSINLTHKSAIYKVNLSVLKSGHLTEDFLNHLNVNIDTSIQVWVAIHVLKKDSGSLSVPYWFPAQLLKSGELRPITKISYPFIPSKRLDPLSEVPILAQMPNVDEAWFSHFGDNSISAWEGLISSCQNYIQELAGANWELNFLEAEGKWCDEGLIYLPKPGFDQNSEMFKLLSHLNETPYTEELTDKVTSDLYPYYLGCLEEGQALHFSEMKTYFHLLSLPEYSMQAITAPNGTQVSALIKDLIASCWLKAAVNEESKPKIGVITANPIPSLFSDQIVTHGHESYLSTLKSNFKNLEQGINTLFSVTHQQKVDASLDERVINIQKKDQRLEEKANYLNQCLELWRKNNIKPGLLKRYWLSLIGGRAKALAKAKQFHKEKLAHLFDFDENTALSELIVYELRGIKVARTKLHNKLMWLTDELTQNQDHHQQLKAWFLENWDECPDFIKTDAMNLAKMMCERMHENLFDSLHSYWVATGVTQSHDKVDIESTPEHVFDWLIITEGEAIMTPAVLDKMSQAKRIIVFGDLASQFNNPILPRRIDDHEINQFNLAASSEEFEELQFRGMTALSSIYELAQDKSYFKRMASHGLLVQNELKLSYMPNHHADTLIFANQFIYANKLINGNENITPPQLSYYHVRHHLSQSIHNWLMSQSLPEKDIGIITLTHAIKIEILNNFKNCKVEVKSIFETKGFTKSVILFVSHVTQLDRKPYLFDEGEQLLNHAVLCAQSQFIIFGDMSVWDPKMRSPSGKLAKIIFKKNAHPLSFNFSDAIVGSEAHLAEFNNALNSVTHSLTLVSEGLEAKTIQKLDLINQFKLLKKKNINICCYIGTKGIIGQGSQTKGFKQQLLALLEAGATVYLVRHLHSNALWWDESHFIEGQFSWLAGFGKLSKHALTSQILNIESKNDFVNYLENHKISEWLPSKMT